jgi:hypothetical protein
MVGHVLAGNPGMLALCAKLGFHIADHPEDMTLKRVTLALEGARPGAG